MSKPHKRITKPPASKDLVPVGPKHVATKGSVGKSQAAGERPTTTRALVLRNGKQGARGTGELVLATTKLSGREKLDLLAEDLVERSSKAVSSPFRLEEALKIAQSQYDACLDEIINLQDSTLFFGIINAELLSRTPQGPAAPLQGPSYVAAAVATRIHNSYMSAAAWKLALDMLQNLVGDGLTDQNVKTKLKKEGFRTRYLVLYDMVNTLVNMNQTRFSLLATTTPHYSRYFKKQAAHNTEPGDPEIIFDWSELRQAALSFLDSIIIELCFPSAPYPRQILYQILHDAIEELPRESKRFPQAMWDAAGDLSISVNLQQLLESPLLGPEGKRLRDSPRVMPEEYEHWVDAQIHSEKASSQYASYKNIVFPLERTKRKMVLDAMWKHVNLTYQSICGHNITTLWHLDTALDRPPQWHSYYIPEAGHDSDYDSDGDMPLLSSTKNRKEAIVPLAITNGNGDDSAGSMPPLETTSSAEDDSEYSDSDSDMAGGDDIGSSEDESGYDTEEEDEIRELLREAMDAAHEANYFNTGDIPSEAGSFSQNARAGNPFLKLLGSLRGRMFSANPKLRTTNRTEPRPIERKTVPISPPTGATAKSSAAAESSRSHRTTLEEVDDEDQAPSVTKKKKKPKKKKKSRSSNVHAVPNLGGPITPSSPLPDRTDPTSAKSPVVPVVQSKPQPSSTTKTSVKPVPPLATSPPISPPRASTANATAHMSTTSLAMSIEPQSAQSARSYIQAEGLDSQKNKTKSRPDHASLFSIPEKKGFMSKLMGRNKKDEGSTKEPTKQSWFSKLSKKTTQNMHQLLKTSEDETKGIAPMKWESFLKIMREMGFKYDPSTAGSSVRFDPPDSRDKPITFHKPHPDTTLYPHMVREYGKRLKRQYGWTEAEFTKHMNAPVD